jgi:hypothetical protein
VTGQWFSPGPTISSTNKTDSQDITEILLYPHSMSGGYIAITLSVRPSVCPSVHTFVTDISGRNDFKLGYLSFKKNIISYSEKDQTDVCLFV